MNVSKSDLAECLFCILIMSWSLLNEEVLC